MGQEQNQRHLFSQRERQIRCTCCKKPLNNPKNMHVLSIRPIWLGGTTGDPKNTALSCGPCKNEWYAHVKSKFGSNSEFNKSKDAIEDAHSSFLESIKKSKEEQNAIRLFLLTRGKV